YMFIGISADKTQAEAIANLYKQNDQDVWVKPFTVQVNKGQLNNKTNQILSEAKPVIVKILKGCGNGFSGEGSSVSEEEWQKLQTQIEKLKQDETKAAQPLVENLVQASAYFEKYRVDSKLAHLWQVQQSLLLAVENYKQLGSGN
ncbi:MAG TPA: hypothetical protein VFK37_05865, partial [Bacillales bacterium]|nr:hypothetical protein [Bacillales bacterium]